jgi:hypothetical protein
VVNGSFEAMRPLAQQVGSKRITYWQMDVMGFGSLFRSELGLELSSLATTIHEHHEMAEPADAGVLIWKSIVLGAEAEISIIIIAVVQ